MDTELIIMLIIVCILICQFIDRIQMIRIEDKIDELRDKIDTLENK